MGAAIPLRVQTPADRRGRLLTDLRISVIDRCNFRCPYCMPEEHYPRDHAFLAKSQRLRFEEIARLATLFAGLGVRKLRLTGGEPLLRRDLPELVRQLAAVPGIEDLALTTNGSLLPAQARPLRAAGLDRITLSLDSLDPVTYRVMSGGRGELVDAFAAIDAATEAGFGPLKINCVVLRGVNDDEVETLVARFRRSGHVLRFIEYMDVGTCNGWDADRVVPSAELRARIAARWPLRPLEPWHDGEVAQRWAFDDGGGEIGFISSVSQPFCGDCSRARLSADGRLYTCLFARDGFDLRGPLRAGASDEELTGLIRSIWTQRADRYSELRAAAVHGPARVPARIEMYEIGG